MTKIHMFVIGSILFAASLSSGKQAEDIRYKKGLMKSIRCVFAGQKTQTGPTIGSVDFQDADNTVCDPLSGNAAASPENGLLAKLYVKSASMTSVTGVMDYYNKGDVIDKKIYFADVNVPTRLFTEGFSTQAGSTLVDANGNKLIENFALEYTSVLQLADGDQAGHYEIASLADDGARVFIKEGDKWNEIINNDGNHATRMGCPYRTVYLDKNSKIPVKVLYYQGPRYHLANVLIWKRHNAAHSWKNPSNHSLCGFTGNDYFYISKNGKKGLAMTYLEFTGWNTIPAKNYKMPDQASNPCSVDPLALTDFAIGSLSGGSATFSWKTNYPSNSQLRIINQFTFEEVYTDVDANMVTNHTASLSGLTPGVMYYVQGISVDAQGRVVRSGLITLAP